MKKIILLLLLTSCGPSEENSNTLHNTMITGLPCGITIIKINGCEYIYCEVTYGCAIIHAANCKNPHN